MKQFSKQAFLLLASKPLPPGFNSFREPQKPTDGGKKKKKKKKKKYGY